METQIILQKPHENVSIEYSVEYQSAGKAFCLCGLLAQFCSTAWFNQFTACRSLPECTCWAFPTLVTFYMCTPLPLLRSIPYHLIWPNSRSISGSSRNGRIPTLLNLKDSWSHTKLPIFPEGLWGFETLSSACFSVQRGVPQNLRDLTFFQVLPIWELVTGFLPFLCILSLDSPGRSHDVKHHVHADDFQTCSLVADRRDLRLPTYKVSSWLHSLEMCSFTSVSSSLCKGCYHSS